MLESCEDSEIARELLELLGVSSGHVVRLEVRLATGKPVTVVLEEVELGIATPLQVGPRLTHLTTRDETWLGVDGPHRRSTYVVQESR